MNSSSSVKIEKQNLRGAIVKVNYSSVDTGFTVIEVETADSPFPVKVVGEKLPLTIGTEILASGYYRSHEKFGRQFKVEFCEEVAPSTPGGLKKFLGSGFISGIGEKTAQLIVDHFGMDALNIVHQHPHRLLEITGIGKKKAEQIYDSIKEHKGELEIRQYFSDVGISGNLGQKIIARYKDEAMKVVKTDPYQLAYDIRGIGFIKADDIGKQQNIPADSPKRIKAALFYTLTKAVDDGHCYLSKEILAQKACSILKISSIFDFEEIFQELIIEEKVILDDNSIYLKNLYEAEEYIANFIIERASKTNINKISDPDIRSAIKNSERDFEITLSDDQVQSVEMSANNNFMIITGGPGCGKTTVIRSIVKAYSLADKKIMLAAPTGKAAQRLSEVSGVTASTIHRLLRYDAFTRKFTYAHDYPLMIEDEDGNEDDLDLLIVDEASMIDLELAKSLFSALSDKTTIILVGDKDQLPSVGPGLIFADLLASNAPQIVLKTLFRRAEESYITKSAYEINQGIIPDIPIPDGTSKKDAYFVQRKNTSDIANTIESLIKEQIPSKFGIKQENITILTPTNRGEIGTIELNNKIQDAINPYNNNEPKILNGLSEFRVNDLVCQRVNNYTIDPLGVFNGDIGRIIDINTKDKEIIVELWDKRHIRYEQHQIYQLSLSYVMSIHRSQGSEIPCVVLALHESQFALLDRQLLYTAITRAKKLLIIVGSKKALSIACKRAQSLNRNTGLQNRIRKKLNE